MKIHNKFTSMLTLIFIFTIMVIGISNPSFATKKKYANWQAVAADMAIQFDDAMQNVENDNYKEAYKNMNEAYFGHYEVQGFEKNVMVYISRDRVNNIEASFADIKHTLLGNQEGNKQKILKDIELLKVKVYKDAMVLDGVVAKDDLDEVGFAVFGESSPKYLEDTTSTLGETSRDSELATSNTNAPIVAQADPKQKNWATFLVAFGLLLREGLEAILVVVAIITYLVKTDNEKLCKNVYWGVVWALLASVVLAVGIQIILHGSGVARELIEGWTMFLAVIVLFYVGNWMLSKADNIAWERYINDKVIQSIDKRSANTLIFAAFLAVFREGAELILFYQASFSSGMDNPLYIVLGIIAASIVLAIIYVSYRYLTVKIPLKPFFIATSILLFLMCISFMGKGVIELTEANVISGRTIIPAMNGFNLNILNITDRAETLIPQIMIAIASGWMLFKSFLSKKKKNTSQSK